MFSETGILVEQAAYSTYGTPSIQAGNVATPFGFQDAYTDTSGLVYLVNRTYTPGTAQFLSVDPMLTATGQPYAMEGDNPLNHTDPLGLLLAPAQGGCDCPLPLLPSPQNVSIHHTTTTAHQSFANAAQVEVQVPDVTRHEEAQLHATVGADEHAVAHAAIAVGAQFATSVQREYTQAKHLVTTAIPHGASAALSTVVTSAHHPIRNLGSGFTCLIGGLVGYHSMITWSPNIETALMGFGEAASKVDVYAGVLVTALACATSTTYLPDNPSPNQ